MAEIVMKMLEHWGWVIVLYFLTSWVKLISNIWLKSIELRVLNQNQVRIEISDSHQLLEIKSSTMDVRDLEKLGSIKLIDNKKVS